MPAALGVVAVVPVIEPLVPVVVPMLPVVLEAPLLPVVPTVPVEPVVLVFPLELGRVDEVPVVVLGVVDVPLAPVF